MRNKELDLPMNTLPHTLSNHNLLTHHHLLHALPNCSESAKNDSTFTITTGWHVQLIGVANILENYAGADSRSPWFPTLGQFHPKLLRSIQS